jgi:rhomboid protease GluP
MVKGAGEHPLSIVERIWPAALELHLFWVVVAVCALGLARLIAADRSELRGAMVVCVGILTLAGVSWLVIPAHSEAIVVAAWIVFMVAPALLSRLMVRRIMQERYGSARALAWIVGVLHPFDSTRRLPCVLDALEAARQGETGRASAMLLNLENDPRASASARNIARGHRLRLTRDWEAFLDGEGGAQAIDDPKLLSMRVRALGECGRLCEMVWALSRTRALFGATNVALDQLFVLAFCGRRSGVEALVHGPLSALGSEVKAFWLATASLAAGDPGGEGRAALSALAGSGASLSVRNVAQWRLANPPANPREQLGPEEWRVVEHVEDQIRGDLAFGGRPSGEWRSAMVIMAMIVINLALFAWEETHGGGENAQTLYGMGGMWPQSVTEHGEWWRLLAATFLHFGYAHLALNMAALAVLGPFVERMLGHWRTLALYLAAGVGSSAMVLFITTAGWVDERMLIGASGAIFGLVGAQIVLLADGWRSVGSKLAGQRLTNMASIVVLQVAFDLMTPEVSMAAHMFGLLIGAAAAAVLKNSYMKEVES